MKNDKSNLGRRRNSMSRIAPVAPPCFVSRSQWVEWLLAALEVDCAGQAQKPIVSNNPWRFNHAIDYCVDCKQAYQDAMTADGKCKPSFVRQQAPGALDTTTKE